MGFYVRAFCTSPEVPALRTVLSHALAQGVTLQLGPGSPALDLSTRDWREAELLYKPDKGPLLCSIDRDDGTPDCLFREEVQEFEEEILSEAHDTPARRRVLDHLRRSRYVAAVQLLADIDDDGQEAQSQVIGCFIENAGALCQVDGEGFFDGPELILPLR